MAQDESPGETLRRSARIVLLSPAGTVLLIRFSVERAGGIFTFWATPGGTVESGETDAEAAARELAEELRLHLPLEGPIHTVTDRFGHQGTVVTNTDVFFAARCEHQGVALHAVTPEERRAMQTTRWWSADEIESSRERIFPPVLAELVRRHGRVR